MRTELERVIEQIGDIVGIESPKAKRERLLTILAVIVGSVLAICAIVIFIYKLFNREDDDFDEFLEDYYDEDTDEFFEDEEDDEGLSS